MEKQKTIFKDKSGYFVEQNEERIYVKPIDQKEQDESKWTFTDGKNTYTPSQVQERRPKYSSAYDPYALTDLLDWTAENTIGLPIKLAAQTETGQKALPYVGKVLSIVQPSKWVGTFSGKGAPWSESNTGFGDDKHGQAMNTEVDWFLSPFLAKGAGAAAKGVASKSSNLLNNYLDLQVLKRFNSRYEYNLIKPKTSIIFNNDKLDRLFQHTVNVHNTFVRGVDPFEAIKFGRFPKGSNPEDVARYSLTHIPKPTASNDAGLLPGENALYTSNSISLAQRYTNGNGYIGILRRPIKHGFSTRRKFLLQNDFRFNPIPGNRLSITTDYPKDFSRWTKRMQTLTSTNPRRFLDRVPKYELTPENQFQVRANAGAFPIKQFNMTDNHFRHYLFVGNEGDTPLQLIKMYPVKTSKKISDYDFSSVGLSHKK